MKYHKNLKNKITRSIVNQCVNDIKKVYIEKNVRWIVNENNEKWIGITEAAEYMDVTKDTVRNWIKKTDIPAHKIGKLWKFKKSELDVWIKSGRSAI